MNVLSQKNKDLRLDFVTKYSGKFSNLKNTFSDEKHFDLNGNKRMHYKYKVEHSIGRNKFNPNRKIFIFGDISW